MDGLAPYEEFVGRMDAMIRQVRGAPKAAGTERIYLPGEIEFELAERNGRDGIPLADPTVEELSALGTKLGVVWPFAE